MKYDFYICIFYIYLDLILSHKFQKILSESSNLKISSILAIHFSVNTLKATKIIKAF